MKKNVAEKVCLTTEDSPAPQSFISAYLVEQPESLFFYNLDYFRQHQTAPSNHKSSVPGPGYLQSSRHLNRITVKRENFISNLGKCCAMQERKGELSDFCKENVCTGSPPSATL